MEAYEERIEGFIKEIRQQFESIYRKGCLDGYKDGYDKCKLEMQKSEISQDEVYKAGHTDGYDASYSEGFQDGLQYNAERETEWNTENFKNGWEEGFEMGLQEADKCIRKIFIDRGFLNSTLFNVFGFYNPFEVLEHYSIKEIITRLEKYQKGEDECK